MKSWDPVRYKRDLTTGKFDYSKQMQDKIPMIFPGITALLKKKNHLNQ